MFSRLRLANLTRWVSRGSWARAARPWWWPDRCSTSGSLAWCSPQAHRTVVICPARSHRASACACGWSWRPPPSASEWCPSAGCRSWTSWSFWWAFSAMTDTRRAPRWLARSKTMMMPYYFFFVDNFVRSTILFQKFDQNKMLLVSFCLRFRFK